MNDNIILQKIDSLMGGKDEKTLNENSNKDGKVIPVQRDLSAGIIAKEYAKKVLPAHIMEAHDKGFIHFHDLDYSPQYPMFNCMLIDIDGMFKKGFKMGNTEIETPKSFGVACQVVAQVIANVSSHIYGGNSINGIDRILAPYVKMSFKKHFLKASEWLYCEDFPSLPMLEEEYGELEHSNQTYEQKFPELFKIATDLTLKEIKDGVQALEYEVNTMYSANGQTPFTTFGIESDLSWEGREIQKAIFKNRIKGIGKNGKTPVFPKLVYMLEEGNNVKPTDPNYDIKQLALECQSKRMYPDIVSKKLIEEVTGDFKFPMGCRSFLGAYKKDGKNITDGRMNLGVVTVNLPRIAILSKGDESKFYELLDKNLDLCFEALMLRINRLNGITSDVAPILYQEGATGFRLKAGETIEHIFKGGYATVSLGYIGIHETVISLYGHKAWGNPEIQAKAENIVAHLKKRVDYWKMITDYGFSLYSTPSENLCYRFCELDTQEFGVIGGVTDKGYYTNSFHLDVNECVNPFDKIRFESIYPKHASGGFISYVELNSLQHNLKALEMIWDFAVQHTPYFAINTPTDMCFECGFSGEFNATELGYCCPNCFNNNPKTTSVIRRCCGYLSEPSDRPFNKGKQIEVTKRVKHM